MSTHEHSNAATDDLSEHYSQATWDERYSSSTRVWSGNPNPRLVEHVTGLPTGDALDVGAGEGADAVWLASQGWQVTALDISPVALARVREHADEAGVGARVRTQHQDLITDATVPGSYDLVSAQYWHPPLDRRVEFASVLGAAVRPGGTLLIVGHHPFDLSTGLRSGHGHPELLFTAEDIVALLPQAEWEIRVADAAERSHQGHGGHEGITVTDAVVMAVRR